jgi:hypothetical protein
VHLELPGQSRVSLPEANTPLFYASKDAQLAGRICGGGIEV